jgi:hypothetical protein
MGRHVSRPPVPESASPSAPLFGLQNAVLGLSNTSAPHLDFQHFGLSLLSGVGIEQLFRVIVVVEDSKGK